MSDRLLVTGLVVLVAGTDGKLRLAPLTMKQSARVRRFVTNLHGGNLHLGTEDLLLLTEADALETFGKLTGKLPIRERFWRSLDKLIHRKRTASQSRGEVPEILNKKGAPEATVSGQKALSK